MYLRYDHTLLPKNNLQNKKKVIEILKRNKFNLIDLDKIYFSKLDDPFEAVPLRLNGHYTEMVYKDIALIIKRFVQMKNKKNYFYWERYFIHKIFRDYSKIKKLIFVAGIISDSKNKFNSDFVDLNQTSKIPFFKTSNINSKTTFKWINKIDPDYIFCFGYSQLIKDPILKKYKGRIVISSLIFTNPRGRNPIIWSILLNKNYSGKNFFQINKKPDAGDIIDHCEIRIKKNMNASDLYSKIIKTVQKRIPIMLKKLLLKKKLIKNISKINLRKRKSGEEVVDWRMSNKFIHNLVRALSKPMSVLILFIKKEIFVRKDFIS